MGYKKARSEWSTQKDALGHHAPIDGPLVEEHPAFSASISAEALRSMFASALFASSRAYLLALSPSQSRSRGARFPSVGSTVDVVFPSSGAAGSDRATLPIVQYPLTSNINDFILQYPELPVLLNQAAGHTVSRNGALHLLRCPNAASGSRQVSAGGGLKPSPSN
jgi:hypothetical protein